MISADLAGFIESGVSILVGSRDASLLPECIHAAGARVEGGGAGLTVFLPLATSATTVANLRENGRIAVTFSRPGDHRAVQVKGRVAALREGDEAAREAVERHRGALARALSVVGVPPRLTLRTACWPCLEARLHVEGVFLQTPGPGAGAPLATGSP